MKLFIPVLKRADISFDKWFYDYLDYIPNKKKKISNVMEDELYDYFKAKLYNLTDIDPESAMTVIYESNDGFDVPTQIELFIREYSGKTVKQVMDAIKDRL